MNLKDLRAWATEYNVAGRSKMNKADLQAEYDQVERSIPKRKPEDYENALKAVVGITMDTLRGESPFEPPADEPDPEIRLTGPGLGALAEMLDLNVEADPEGVQEFVAVMQGVVDEHRQRKRSKTVRRARRSRINKRGF